MAAQATNDTCGATGAIGQPGEFVGKWAVWSGRPDSWSRREASAPKPPAQTGNWATPGSKPAIEVVEAACRQANLE